MNFFSLSLYTRPHAKTQTETAEQREASTNRGIHTVRTTYVQSQFRQEQHAASRSVAPARRFERRRDTRRLARFLRFPRVPRCLCHLASTVPSKTLPPAPLPPHLPPTPPTHANRCRLSHVLVGVVAAWPFGRARQPAWHPQTPALRSNVAHEYEQAGECHANCCRA